MARPEHFHSTAPRRTNSHSVGWAVAVGAIGAIVITILAASSGPGDIWQDPRVQSEVTVSDTEPPPDNVINRQPSDDGDKFEPTPIPLVFDVVGVLIIILIGVAATLAVSDRGNWLWRVVRRDRSRRTSRVKLSHAEPAPNSIEIDLEAAEAALVSGLPRNAIVECWMQLERDASAVGLPRLAAETSAEYVERVIASSSITPVAIGDLASLYREARFSEHELNDDQRERARVALRDVVSRLRRTNVVTR